MQLTIKWNKRAITQFDEAIAYIESDSISNAEKVKRDILFKINDILKHPEIHRLDKYKINNDNTYRAFEIHRFRITYRYTKGQIRIIRIRHTKMSPLFY